MTTKTATVIHYLDTTSRTEGLCTIRNSGRIAARLSRLTLPEWGEIALAALVQPLLPFERDAVIARYRQRQLIAMAVMNPSVLDDEALIDLAWDFSDAIEALAERQGAWATILKSRESQIRRLLARRTEAA